ncbi:MAG: phosphotransferase [Actinomycetia bacterium]|nr:phosphotransferase [Actinomycetes bacterium]MCP3909631.1 phosphotransferase [Actinomycetes bacterium]MCP4086177.1 phosphotransferase [Actinomycetes bacterium]
MFERKPTPTPELAAAARAAAVEWDLDAGSIELVAIQENAVFRAERAGAQGPVALRLHRPGYNSRAELESEVAWVSALREAGLDLPGALPNRHGEFYRAFPVGSEQREVGVIEWIDGSPLGESLAHDSSRAAEHHRRLGALAARVHDVSERWPRPPDFSRRSWDVAGLVGQDPLWGRFWEVDGLTPAQADLLLRARASTHDVLAGLATTDDYGLIHADLHLHNVLVTDDDRLVMIDFDDAGYGWYAHELAVALHPSVGEPYEVAARQALVQGYREVRPLSDDQVTLIDTFLLIRHLMLVAWLDARPELGLQAEMPGLVEAATQAAERRL